jgi:hypothetical protein
VYPTVFETSTAKCQGNTATLKCSIHGPGATGCEKNISDMKLRKVIEHIMKHVTLAAQHSETIVKGERRTKTHQLTFYTARSDLLGKSVISDGISLLYPIIFQVGSPISAQQQRELHPDSIISKILQGRDPLV